MGWLSCCCGCAYITELWTTPNVPGSLFAFQTLTTIDGWTEAAGDWSKQQGSVWTASDNAVLICNTQHPSDPPSSKALIICDTNNRSVGNQYRWLFAIEDVDNWIGVQWHYTNATTGGGVLSFIRSDAGVVTDIGYSFNTFVPSVVEWDGTDLIVGFQSLYNFIENNAATYSMRIDDPTTGYKVGLGSGSNAGSTDVKYTGFTAYYEVDDRANCRNLSQGCNHCANGGYASEWQAEFSGFTDRDCNRCAELNTMVIALTNPGVPYQMSGGCFGCPNINIAGKPIAGETCNWTGAQQMDPTDTFAGYDIVCPDGFGDNKEMYYHDFYVSYYDPDIVTASQGGSFPISLSLSGKWVLQYCINIRAEGSYQCGPIYQSAPIDALDCTGETSYTLTYNRWGSPAYNPFWRGCWVNVGETITVTPVNGVLP